MTTTSIDGLVKVKSDHGSSSSGKVHELVDETQIYSNNGQLPYLKFKFRTLAGSSDGGAAFNSGPGLVSISEFEYWTSSKV